MDLTSWGQPSHSKVKDHCASKITQFGPNWSNSFAGGPRPEPRSHNTLIAVVLFILYYTFTFLELFFPFFLFLAGRGMRTGHLRSIPTLFAFCWVPHNPISLWQHVTLLCSTIIAFIPYTLHDIFFGVLSISQKIKRIIKMLLFFFWDTQEQFKLFQPKNISSTSKT